ncbi:MAG TPA: hypothetical protein DHV85_01005, partial [Candidatus Accumulibacter sp.]|nr:hypothetical protein [Accumulibacter sp.]
MSTNTRRIVFFLVIAVLAILSGLYAWQQSRPAALPAGFVAGNGRIESTEIDIATRSAGRVKEILCREGDFVEAGQIVARMDTQTLEAELHQLQAKVKQAESASSASIASQKLDAKAGAIALVEQRRQAKTTALAAVAQSESEVAFAESELQRSEERVAKGFITAQRLQGDKTKLEIARASLDAARSKVAEAQAAIAAAQSPALETQPAIAAYESQVSESESSIEAAIAATEKIKADMADATLRSPRAGRVQ